MSARNLDIATAAWGGNPSAWVALLARECDRSSQAAVAKLLDYSGTVINQVIHAKYPGSYEAVEQAVRGRFDDLKVSCPVLGSLAAHRCLENQRAPWANTNPLRVRLFKACRACPNALVNAGAAGKEKA